MTPLTEKCNRGSTESELSSTTPRRTSPTSNSQATSSSSAAHSNTRPHMPDDSTTATTAHGLQLHPAKTQSISNTTSRHRKKGHTVAVQGMNIEILPAKNQILWPTCHVQSPHQMRVGNAHEPRELTSPKYPLKCRFHLFGVTVTPSLFYAVGTWTMTEEIKQKLQTTQRRMMRMIIRTENNR